MTVGVGGIGVCVAIGAGETARIRVGGAAFVGWDSVGVATRRSARGTTGGIADGRAGARVGVTVQALTPITNTNKARRNNQRLTCHPRIESGAWSEYSKTIVLVKEVALTPDMITRAEWGDSDSSTNH